MLRWTVSEDGQTVTADLETPGEPILDLSAVRSGPSGLSKIITSVITKSGNLKTIYWEPKDAELKRRGELVEGAVAAVDIAEYAAGRGFLVGAVRTTKSQLGLATWRLARSGGNEFIILHGDCRVAYAHFKAGSINMNIAFPGATVYAGQFLGQMGNCGESTGPHLHVHAAAIDSTKSVEELIADERNGVDEKRLPFRPVPFSCAWVRRMDTTTYEKGSGISGPLSALEGQGVYFTNFAIKPGGRGDTYVDSGSFCITPQGNPECTLGLYGGPFHTVNEALDADCWGPKLFVHKGHYDESVLIDRSMIIRSYDGSAVIGTP